MLTEVRPDLSRGNSWQGRSGGKPSQEPTNRLKIGGPRVSVANVCREEFVPRELPSRACVPHDDRHRRKGLSHRRHSGQGVRDLLHSFQFTVRSTYVPFPP
jgi:hypothetical protein